MGDSEGPVPYGSDYVYGVEILATGQTNETPPRQCSDVYSSGDGTQYAFTPQCSLLSPFALFRPGARRLCNLTEQAEQRDAVNGCLPKGNPCDVLNGNKQQREVDYSPKAGVLEFVRTYNSQSFHTAKQGPLGAPLGECWFGSYLQYLSAPTALNSSVVHVVRPSGDVVEFTATNPGSTSTEYEVEGEFKERLVVALNTSGAFVGWRYITATDDAELYDTNGRLLSIKNRGGATEALTYGSNDRVESVVDDFGHALTFQWDSSTPPRLTNVVLPGSGSGDIEFTYGSYNNLVSVTHPDTSDRQYLYELTGSSQRHLLTGIEDESGGRYATWGYNSEIG